MKEKPQIVSRILSLFEKFWFSDILMGMFIVFPAGMWAMMALIVCVSFLTHPLYLTIAIIALIISSFLTVLLSLRKTWKKDNGNSNQNK